MFKMINQFLHITMVLRPSFGIDIIEFVMAVNQPGPVVDFIFGKHVRDTYEQLRLETHLDLLEVAVKELS